MDNLPPPAPKRRTNYGLWIALGLGGGLLGVVLLLGAVLLGFPRLRDELVLLVNPPVAAAPAPPEAPRKDGALLLVPAIDETFDAPNDRWELADGRIENGGYELRVETPNFDSYGLYLNESGAGISNIDLAVDVTQTAGPLDAEYGVRFRQPGPENYLMFSVSSGGYYRLLRVGNGEYASLVAWTFSPRINSGLNATNRLRVVAEGGSVRGFINGQEVLNVADTTSAGGQLGLGVTTFEQGGAVVRFDNLEGQAEGQGLAQTFDDPEAAPWSVGGSRIADGQYEMFAAPGIQLLQQPRPPGSTRSEAFSLEVDAALAEGGPEAAYGVMFGYSENFAYYGLLLLPDGRLFLYRTDPEGEDEVLIPPTPVEAIRTGLNARNTLSVAIENEQLTVTINNETVIEDAPIGPVEGEVGLLLSSGREGRARAQFNSFRFAAQGQRT